MEVEHSEGVAAAKILIVEDDAVARKNLHHVLKKEGYEVLVAETGVRGADMLQKEGFDLVLTDLKMDRVDGFEILKRTQDFQPDTEVIIITAYATVDTAVQALKMGAYHYIAKPYKIDEIRKVVKEALLKRRLVLENRQLREALDCPSEVPAIIGKSKSMMEVIRTIRQIASSDANVLVLGESGTGKELVARAVHHLSSRKKKKFVAFNCGSFTEELIASELFGHEKGAFSGAIKEKAGLLEVAEGGTVFLDEIGDMPHAMQVRLLRAIQEKEIQRVGGVNTIPIDVRFIAATHRDLQKDIEKGFFRQDLFYRLNVISITLPPLSERDGDIPLLAYHFLAKKSREMGKDIREIDREAIELLSQYAWPGNVRELENVIERSVAFQNGPRIQVDDLPDYIQNISLEMYRFSTKAIPSREEQEKRYLRWVLEKCQGNRTEAAKIMGIDRVSLWRKLKRYNMEQ